MRFLTSATTTSLEATVAIMFEGAGASGQVFLLNIERQKTILSRFANELSYNLLILL